MISTMDSPPLWVQLCWGVKALQLLHSQLLPIISICHRSRCDYFLITFFKNEPEKQRPSFSNSLKPSGLLCLFPSLCQVPKQLCEMI